MSVGPNVQPDAPIHQAAQPACPWVSQGRWSHPGCIFIGQMCGTLAGGHCKAPVSNAPLHVALFDGDTVVILGLFSS
jgi:hypothetical protein